MRRTPTLCSRLNVEALNAELEAIASDVALGPEEAARRIVKAVRRGGRQAGGFSRGEFLDLLAENGMGCSASLLSSGALGHWETGRNICPPSQLDAIMQIYSALGLRDFTSLVARLKPILERAGAERYKNKRLLASLFQSRDLPDLRHAGFSDPADADGRTYTYWVAEPGSADRDLDDFVALSDGEVQIVESHPDLTPHARRALYARWLRRSPLSFMSLRKYDPGSGVAPVIAISIMLPLTTEGADRVWNRDVDAVTLAEGDLADATGEPLNLLLDTWIVRREARKESSIDYAAISRRVDHGGVGGMLIPLHAGLFWDGVQAATIFVEPASPKIESLCAQLGFECRRSPSRASDRGCYRLTIPRDPGPALAQRLMGDYVGDLRKVAVRNMPIDLRRR